MTDLIDTTEMYLRTILELEEENLVPIRARISDRLGHSGPTVSQTISRMERDGLVEIAPDRSLVLTDAGRLEAVHVMRKHRLAERLLSDVIGLEWEFVHEEACRWEHVMSEKVERRLIQLLGNPHESPYGNPIPGLAELGSLPSREFTDGVISLADAVDAGRGRAAGMLKRLGEPIQSDMDLLSDMRRAGLVPGANIVVSLEGKTATLSPVDDEGGVVVTSREALLHLFIVS